MTSQHLNIQSVITYTNNLNTYVGKNRLKAIAAVKNYYRTGQAIPSVAEMYKADAFFARKQSLKGNILSKFFNNSKFNLSLFFAKQERNTKFVKAFWAKFDADYQYSGELRKEILKARRNGISIRKKYPKLNAQVADVKFKLAPKAATPEFNVLAI